MSDRNMILHGKAQMHIRILGLNVRGLTSIGPAVMMV